MLPPQNRIKKTKDFERVFRNGSFVNDKFITFKFARNELNFTRFGFIVSMKVSKKAVARNKVKRWLRAAVFPFLKNINPGFDIVVMTRPEILKSDFREIQDIVTRILSRVNNLNIRK